MDCERLGSGKIKLPLSTSKKKPPVIRGLFFHMSTLSSCLVCRVGILVVCRYVTQSPWGMGVSYLDGL
jgi:hypothetical protein